MSELNEIPADFDLEAFQRQVAEELVNTFYFPPPGKKTVVAKSEPPGPFYLLRRSESTYIILGFGLLGGFLLGGGDPLAASVNRNITFAVIGVLFVRAGYLFWWHLKMRRLGEERSIKRQEAYAKERIASLQAGEILAEDDIKTKICPVLQDLANDVFVLANTIQPVLLTLHFTGRLPGEFDPLIGAAVAATIFKTGIKAYCGEPSGK